jgi:hypothetical protein
VITRKGLRLSLKEWFGSLEPNLYLTHNFGFRAAAETREKSLKRFYSRMQSRVHGRNWNKRETDQPMVAVGIWEHLDSNPHCHVLVAASDDERSWLLAEGNDSWLWLQPRGQFEIGEIESLPRVFSYVTKELHKISCSSTKRRLRIRGPRIRGALAAPQDGIFCRKST